jgi:regulator of sigma E protease
VRHLLGLTPVLMVRPGTDPAQGLESGDVFAQLGTAEYPSIARGVTEIRGRTGQPIDIVVERTTGTGTDRVEIDAEVTRMGTVGFVIDDTADRSTMLSLSPRLHTSVLDERATPQPAGTLSIRPGARVVAVNGERVETFFDIRGAIERSLSGAPTDTGNETRVPITLIPSPAIDGVEPPLYETELVLSADHVSAIRALSWLPPVPPGLFVYEERDLRAGGPVEAVSMGLVETRRVMITAYVTFARLFQGTIKVEHLKGPVGIAHIGTIVAGKGPVWLLFFLALISVNLAVINFLPIPIVDGGQFLMLCYEGVARKPVPIVVQNGLTLAGLALIGVVFIVVTVNDVRQLLGL